MDESEAGIESLRALRALGVRLVLDDFGTGYSSLSYLKHLPLDTIKIDRSFVTELTGDDANLPIVQAVIALAHGLGIDVVGGGDRDRRAARVLRELACDRGQGYLYARPLPAGELIDLLRADRPFDAGRGPDRRQRRRRSAVGRSPEAGCGSSPVEPTVGLRSARVRPRPSVRRPDRAGRRRHRRAPGRSR